MTITKEITYDIKGLTKIELQTILHGAKLVIDSNVAYPVGAHEAARKLIPLIKDSL